MQPVNLIQDLYSYVRLAVGCLGVFFGLAYVVHLPDPAQASLWEKILGVIIGGVGLAVALNETAYVGARFLAGFLKAPPENRNEQPER